MIKKTPIIIMIIVGLFRFYTNVVHAYPVDTGSEYLMLIDTDGNDDSIFTLGLEGDASPNFNSTYTWSGGIYSFSTNSNGDTILGDMLSVYDNSSTMPFATVDFDLIAGTATNNNGDVANIGSNFGIYFTWDDGGNDVGTIFSHADMNTNDVDYFQIMGGDNIFDSYVGFYSDDPEIFGILGVHDAIPAPVPEPTTMLLLGSGLLGMATIWRKGFFKSN